jgi:hypothetical protein
LSSDAWIRGLDSSETRGDNEMTSKIGISEAIDRLRAIDPALDAVWNEAIAYWSPEEPPVILCFGDLARATMALLKAHDPAADRVFELMEVLHRGGDHEVREAVGTGFVEALLGMPPDERDPGWADKLGPNLRYVAEGWMS